VLLSGLSSAELTTDIVLFSQKDRKIAWHNLDVFLAWIWWSLGSLEYNSVFPIPNAFSFPEISHADNK
jgi:hypothetical protein